MGRFVKGDVVVVQFPFSDLSSTKRRPALVLAALKGDDLILCQITSQAVSDEMAVSIGVDDIEGGTLNTVSNARVNKLFTADGNIVSYQIGKLRVDKLSEIVDKLINMFQS
jgi:mRNA interferase MazF